MPPELEGLFYFRMDTWTSVQLWNAFIGQPASN